jgi:hypothetical protein
MLFCFYSLFNIAPRPKVLAFAYKTHKSRAK